MRLGILTGGGDCPGLNAVIRAAVVRTLRTYKGQVVGFEHGWLGLLQDNTRELDLDAVMGVLPRGGTMLGTSRCDPYHEGGMEAVRDAIARHAIEGLIVCGGDGTLSAAARLAAAGLPIVGIPKTIDNDVPGTDFSAGFDTALTTVVHAIDALHSTAESHERVMVVEVMGRNSGWIAVCAAIAGGADVVVTPERPCSISEVCGFVRKRLARGRTFSIVVVAEGAQFTPEPDGRVIEITHRLDSFGRPVYGGVGEIVAREIMEQTGVESRTVTLGHVQRGGTPSAFDRLLGTRMGMAAVDLIQRREFGRMVSLVGGHITSCELAVVQAGARPVDEELYEVARVFSG
jgi:ATP-dependent phosphofructokinase / diphosphate-dependent phosphofructokinase